MKKRYMRIYFALRRNAKLAATYAPVNNAAHGMPSAREQRRRATRPARNAAHGPAPAGRRSRHCAFRHQLVVGLTGGDIGVINSARNNPATLREAEIGNEMSLRARI